MVGYGSGSSDEATGTGRGRGRAGRGGSSSRDEDSDSGSLAGTLGGELLTPLSTPWLELNVAMLDKHLH